MFKILIMMVTFIFSSPAISSQLNIVVSSIPGGGADLQARVIAKHLSKYLPNNQNVNVINMQGGGGLIAANWLYNVADQQSNISILTVNNDVIIKGLIKDENAKYDLTKFKWLFSAEDGSDNVFVLWANSKRGLKSIQDMRQENIFVVGNQGPNNIQSYILQEIVGVKSKIVFGYKDIIRALQINEIDARFGTLMNTKARFPSWLTGEDEIRPILQVGSFNRHPLLNSVPNGREFSRTRDHKIILDYYEKTVRLSRLVFAPPNMSESRIQEILKASYSLETDKEFIEDAKKVEMDVDFIRFEETNSIMKDILSTDVQLLRSLVSKN
jgi:tripartite-type tricarboxylate transporter receptor subunit TctC